MDIKLLSIPPKKIVNKYVSSRELERYFGNSSVEALVVLLRQGRSDGLFWFDITLDPEYIEWGEAKHKAQFTVDFSGSSLGYVRPPRYKFEDLSSKIKASEPFSEDVVQKVITELPHDLAEKYLRFRLHDLDYEKLRENIVPKKRKANKYYERLKYKGLVDDGAVTAYLDQPIYLSRQHRLVLRMFMERPEKLIYREAFIDNREILPGEYSDVYKTLGKLIPAVRKELETVIHQKCILNTPTDGWILKIE